jgi:putative DNA primase/helicase
MNNGTAPQTDFTLTPEPVQLTDAGNAELFAFLNCNNVRYSHTSRKWLIWDGSRWGRDQTGEIQRFARTALRLLWGHASAVQDDDRRRKLMQHALKSEYEGRIRAMITLAQSERGIALTDAALDTDPWLLNVQNGTLNLKTGSLQAHRREDLITKIAPVKFDSTATCPRWEEFLQSVTNNDIDQITFLQKAIGYSLTGSVSEQVIFILYGTGANGKSTFINVIHRILGSDYALPTPTETLLEKRNGGIPNDLARLKGARFVSAVESECDRKLAEALVKQLTGGDKITARHLYAEWFDFEPTFKLFLAVNHKPSIKGSDYAIWRRIRLIPFTVTIPPESQDKHLIEKLVVELPGILRWAVEGCIMWQAEGLKPSASVRAATEEYRFEMDFIGDFIRERCDTSDTQAQESFSALYENFTAWAKLVDETRCVTRKEFADGLSQRSFASDRNSRERFRIGIRMKRETAKALTHDGQ